MGTPRVVGERPAGEAGLALVRPEAAPRAAPRQSDVRPDQVTPPAERAARRTVAAPTPRALELRRPGTSSSPRLEVPSTGLAPAYELEIAQGVLHGVNARVEVPYVGEDTRGRTLRVNTALRNVIFPDGTEVASGRGTVSVIVDGSRVVGLVASSLRLSPDSLRVVRDASAPLDAGPVRPRLLRGGFLVRGERIIGLARDSATVVDGLVITSPADRDVTFAFDDRERLTVGPGALLAAPRDRAYRVRGPQFVVSAGENDLEVTNGEAIVRNGAVALTLGEVRPSRHLPDPPPAAVNAEDIARGEARLRRVRGSLFVDGVSVDDFDQGAVGTCWFIATVHAIAAARPDYIAGMIRDNGDDTYGARLFTDGAWRIVTVDSDLYSEALGSPPRPVYARSRDPRELWGPILEKAAAQASPTGYQGLHGGFPREAFRLMTGAPGVDEQHASISDSRLFERLATATANRVPTVAVASNAAMPAELARRRAELAAVGLEFPHAYAVTGTHQENGQAYVLLRNTSRGNEFRSPQYQADLDRDGDGVLDGLDGHFRMRIDDYRRLFGWTTFLQVANR